MSKIIGVTGIMGSGKTTLCKKLMEKDKDINYINVDNFRLDLRNNNLDFQNELFEKIKGLTNLEDINKYIYTDDKNMSIYKNALYKQLHNHINNQDKNKIIIVDWALIIDDNLMHYFDKIVLLTCSDEEIYRRLDGAYWPLSEVKHRVSLQLSVEEKQKKLEESKKEFLIVNSEENLDYDQIMNFIEE